MRQIQVLSDKEHVLKRANVYIGSIKVIDEERYLVEDNKYVNQKISYTPGLVKIFEEILDNSVDYFVDNNLKAPKGNPRIKIELQKNYFSVEDNGGGIPNEKIDDKYMCEVAWSELRAGSNFNDDNRKSIGTNGMGAALTNIFSKKFIGENKNNNLKVTCEWEDNASKFKLKESKISSSGVYVYCEPDFKRFEKEEFSDNDLKVIKTRIRLLAETYPEIKFILNDEVVKSSEVEF